MFNSKKETLFENKGVTATSVKTNGFVNSAKRESAKTLSANGALKYETTGNPFVDQFGALASFKTQRTYREIEQSMSELWAIDKENSVKFILYIRMISRITQFEDGSKTTSQQRGAGLRHEGIMRMIWLYLNYRDTFWENINLFIAVGSWKDIIQMMNYDIQFNGWDGRVLDWEGLSNIIVAGLENPNTSELIKKYLPQIKSVKNADKMTIEAQSDVVVGKFLANKIFKEKKAYEQYRKLKSSGTAHQWQQLISRGDMLHIDFDTVHGRALSLLVSSKFLDNQNLTAKYEAWIDSKPVAKYTGFVHELFARYSENDSAILRNMRTYEIKTLCKQFDGLVENAKKGAKQGTSLIVVRDTSGSMNGHATGCAISANLIAKSLALFFSEMLNDGAFANSWIEFNRDAKLHQWKGSNVYEKWINDKTNCVADTNFQSVIDLFVKLKKQGVDEGEFPTGILCISDGEFNQSSLNETNIQSALTKLRNGGFSETYISNFQIVLWNLRSNYYSDETQIKFETYGDVKNVYYFSGFDASVIAFLTGVEHQEKQPQTAAELFEAAMNQEVLNMVKV
jgi:hypothetical protein